MPSLTPRRLLLVVVRSWRTVALVTGSAIAISLVLWTLLPKTYRASAVLVPATSQGGGGGASALMAQLPGGLPSMVGASDPQQRLIGTILRSQSLRQAIIESESLPDRRAAIAALMREGVSLDRRPDDGSIIVAVEGPDPALAASTANRFAAAINQIAVRVSQEAANRRDGFLAEQLRAARERLVRSEDAVLSFQQQRSAPEPQEQASRTIEAAAQLQQAIGQAELEVARLRRSLSPDNPQLRAAEADLAMRREQLRQLTSGRAGDPIFIPLRKGPELRVATTRLTREFRKDEQVYVSLTTALAQAQIDANNNLPVLTVLDPARPPGGPAGSILKRLVVAAFLGLMAGIGLVVARELVAHTGDLQRFLAEPHSAA